MNIWLLPLAALLVVVTFRGTITIALMLSLFATAWLLVIGTIALRMLLKSLERDTIFADYWLPKLQRAKVPSLALVAASILMTGIDVAAASPSLTVSQYSAMLFTLLATLEYINYYHYQLQHFDNPADFQRMISGRGFRASHLSRALKRHQRLSQLPTGK